MKLENNLEELDMFCNLDSKEWPSVKLEDVAQVLGGYAFKSKEFSSKGNPIIKIKNVNGRIVDKNDCDLYPVELCKNLSKFIFLILEIFS